MEPFYRLRDYYAMPNYVGQAFRTAFQYARFGRAQPPSPIPRFSRQRGRRAPEERRHRREIVI